MEFNINEKSVRQMAQRLRGASTPGTLTYCQGLDMASRALGYADWNTLRALLLKAEGCRVKLAKPVLFIAQAYSPTGVFDGVSWVQMYLTEAFVHQLVQAEAMFRGTVEKGSFPHALSDPDEAWRHAQGTPVKTREVVFSDHWWALTGVAQGRAADAMEMYPADTAAMVRALTSRGDVESSLSTFHWHKGCLLHTCAEDMHEFIQTLDEVETFELLTA